MTVEKLENGSNWGGKRKNSGRKPLLGKEELEAVKALIAQHGAEEDEKTKKIRTLALLEKLYDLGIAGNVSAVREYLDRVMGRSKESVDVTTDGKALPQPILKLSVLRDNSPQENSEAN